MTDGSTADDAPDMFARYLDDLELGDSFTTKGQDDHRGGHRQLRRADVGHVPAARRRGVGVEDDVRRADRARDARALLRRRTGADAARADRCLLRHGEGALLRPDQDRRHHPRARRAEGEGGARRRHRAWPRSTRPCSISATRRSASSSPRWCSSGELTPSGAGRAEQAHQAAARRPGGRHGGAAPDGLRADGLARRVHGDDRREAERRAQASSAPGTTGSSCRSPPS